MRSPGLLITLVGIVLLLLGLLLHLGGLGWFGRLPGDLRIDRGGFQIWIPFTSTLLVSAALSLLVDLLCRLL